MTEADHPWLRGLLDELDRCVGRRHRELAERLREPLARAAPPLKQRIAGTVLARLVRGTGETTLPPRQVREALFQESTVSTDAREAIVARVAAALDTTARKLEDALFADLPGERVVLPPKSPLSPGELALRANLAMVKAVLFRASVIRIAVEGNARVLARHAKLRGLICTARRAMPSVEGSAPPPDRTSRSDAATLEISGPYALFRQTLVYGRALGELVPLLAWCTRFSLSATCLLRGAPAEFVLSTGDPVFPSAEPRRYDSRLEERFAKDFARAAPDWDLVREPEAVDAGGVLVFPDFLLKHRVDPGKRWLLEIAGFWTPDYLVEKLVRLRAARIENLILCIDEARNCAEGDLPRDAAVVRFRRRIDPAAVLRAMGETLRA